MGLLSAFYVHTYLCLYVSRYGGPGSQTVDERWSVGWHTYLASNRDFIVANIDVRGSGYQVITNTNNEARWENFDL